MESINDPDLTKLMVKFTDLIQYIDELKDSLFQVKLENQNLHKAIASIRNDNDDIFNSIHEIEKKITRSNQYSRRENIEIMNIPEDIPQSRLEISILDILHEMGMKISSYDIAAVHRVGKKRGKRPRNVIICFMSRKDSIFILNQRINFERSARNLQYNGLRVISNLCPENKEIFNKCFKLKKQNVIKYVGTHINGSVYIQLPGDEEFIFIDHYDDIDSVMKEMSRWYYDPTNDTFVVNVESSDRDNSDISGSSQEK